MRATKVAHPAIGPRAYMGLKSVCSWLADVDRHLVVELILTISGILGQVFEVFLDFVTNVYFVDLDAVNVPVDFEAWQQKAAENPYMLEPIVPYGATVEEVMQCMGASSVYHCFRELYENENGWGIWYKMDATNTFYVDFMIDEKKGLNLINYTYQGGDIPLSAAEDALMKRGYHLICEEQVDDGRNIHIFEAPDGVDRVEAWERVGRVGWKFVFVDIAEYYEDAKSRRAPMTMIRSKDSLSTYNH